MRPAEVDYTIATFNKGDQAKFDTYSVTSIFSKTDAGWKIIHDHESGLPAEMIR